MRTASVMLLARRPSSIKRHQERTGARGDLKVGVKLAKRILVGPASDGGAGADNSDVTIPRRGGRRLRAGDDHASDRDRQAFQSREREGGRRVTGDDDRLSRFRPGASTAISEL